MAQDTESACRKDRKSPMDLMKTLQDAFQLCYWVTQPGNDLLIEYLQEMESQVLFYGNRVRAKGKDAEKACFEAFVVVMSTFITFLTERKDRICEWTGKQNGAEAQAFY